MTDQEYQQLKGFLLFFSTHVEGVEPTPTGNRLIDEITKMEIKAPRRAQSSVTMMVNDCLEMTGVWKPGKVAVLDDAFRAADQITLTELRHRYSRQYAKILKRGSIKNAEEYYLLKGVLDGLTPTLSEVEQGRLMEILSDYEERL